MVPAADAGDCKQASAESFPADTTMTTPVLIAPLTALFNVSLNELPSDRSAENFTCVRLDLFKIVSNSRIMRKLTRYHWRSRVCSLTLGHVVDTGNHAGQTPAALAVENLDCNQGCFLCDTILRIQQTSFRYNYLNKFNERLLFALPEFQPQYPKCDFRALQHPDKSQ